MLYLPCMPVRMAVLLCFHQVTAATLKGEALLAPDSPPSSTERTAVIAKQPSATVARHGGSRRSTTTTTVTLSTPKRENYGMSSTTTMPLNKVESIRTSIFSKLSFLCPARFKSHASSHDPQTPSAQNRSNISDQKARLTLGVIMGTFLLCWTPFFIVNIIRSWFPDAISSNTFSAVTWLGYANSSANPLIYSIFNRDFRRAFKKIIINIFGCCWEEPDLNKSISSRFAQPEIERRRSCTKSSESNHDNNNIEHGNATRLTLLANNNDEVIIEEN